MSELLGAFSKAFPLLVAVSAIAILIVLSRVWGRMSSGSVSAGPLRPPESNTPGLQKAPWDAVSVDRSLEASPTVVVELLSQRAKSLNIAISVPANLPTIARIDLVLDQLEAALDLPPLTPNLAPPSK